MLKNIVLTGGLLIAALASAHAQIFVESIGTSDDKISEYSDTGTLINANFVTGIDGGTTFTEANGVLYASDAGENEISTYNATTGAAITAKFISGTSLDNPWGLAVANGNLYVDNDDAGTISEYNATTGTLINASFASGLGSLEGMVISGNNLFVSNNSVIDEFNLTTGALESSISPAGEPSGLTISGNDLYVANFNGTIEEFNITGTTLAKLSSLSTTSGGDTLVANAGNSPAFLSYSNGNLYVSDYSGGTVDEFNAITGAAIGSGTLISGVSAPFGILANPQAVPENRGTGRWPSASLASSPFCAAATTNWPEIHPPLKQRERGALLHRPWPLPCAHARRQTVRCRASRTR